MARPFACVIESLCVDTVEKLHALGEVCSWCLDEQMVVVRHQAVCVTDPTEPGDHTTQHIEELKTVAVSLEDLRPGIAATRDVIEGSFVLDAQRPGHDVNSLANSWSKIKA